MQTATKTTRAKSARTADRQKRSVARKGTGTAVAVSAPPQTFLQAFMQAARDPRVNPEKMAALKQMMTEQQWIESMLAAQSEIGEHKIVKTTYNEHTRSHYIKLEALSAVIDPIARKHGFFLVYGMSDSPLDDHYRITCDVAHKSGHVVHKEVDIGTDAAGPKGGGTKSLAQGSGSSISYGRRYLKAMVFDVAIAGEDHDGATPKQRAKSEVIDQKQLDELTDLLNSTGAPPVDRFCNTFQIKHVEKLPAARFEEAKARIKDYIQKGENKDAKPGRGS